MQVAPVGLGHEQALYALWYSNACLAYEHQQKCLAYEMLALQSKVGAPPGLPTGSGWPKEHARSRGGSYVDSEASTTPSPRSRTSPTKMAPWTPPDEGRNALPCTMHGSVMMRNVPNCYTRDMLVDLLDAEGYLGSFDFLYIPIDFRRGLSLGYAFLNFTSPSIAEGFRMHFTGFSQWSVPSDKVCEITWSDTLHGLESHIQRYINSPVMHAAVPDDHRPLLFDGADRVPFPKPTKKIRAPRIKR